MKLLVKSSPHTHIQKNTARIMREVALCLIPGIILQAYFFGTGVFIQIALAVATALMTEALLLIVRKQPVMTTLLDTSALVTALLIAVTLPPLAPWWLVVIGTFSAIAVAKQLYGGLGHNIFNPAMIGYVVLLIAFPAFMVQWPVPAPLQAQPLDIMQTLQLIFGNRSDALLTQAMLNIDGTTSATALDYFKTERSAGHLSSEILQSNLYSRQGLSVGWFWINCGFLLGGIIMLSRGLIRWHIPVSMLASLALCVCIGFLFSPSTQGSLGLHLFSGATFIGAFFIATDPVSAATSTRGRIIYGALIGLLVYLIRTYGNYPDAVAFAVLLANTAVPLIDLYARPKVYGESS